MNRRTIILRLVVVFLALIASAAGSVLAQGDPSSSSTGEIGTAISDLYYESPPGINSQGGVDAAISSSYGTPGAVSNTVIDESRFQPNDLSVPIASSRNGQNSSVVRERLADEVEPGSVLEQGFPESPAWNASIRFIGSALRPRTSGVGYDTNEQGGCIYATSGDPNIVWNLPWPCLMAQK